MPLEPFTSVYGCPQDQDTEHPHNNPGITGVIYWLWWQGDDYSRGEVTGLRSSWRTRLLLHPLCLLELGL